MTPPSAPGPQQGGAGAPTRRLGRLVAHAALILAGLLIVVYPLTIGAHTDVNCYGRPLQPGQNCAKADGSPGQTYEQRVGDTRAARPVIITVGVLVAGFGTALLIGDLRRRRPISGTASVR